MVDHPFFGMRCGNEQKNVLEELEDLRGGATMIFDTDIFILVQRGNTKAADLMEKAGHRLLSVQTYMELKVFKPR